MVLRVDTSKKVLRKYKYKRGKGVVAKVDRLSKQVRLNAPTVKVYQSAAGGYASNQGDLASNPITGAVEMFAPVTGTGFSNRQNPYVHVKSVDLKWYAITSQTSDIVRFIAFTLTDDFETGVTVANLFLTNTGGANAPIGNLQPSSLCSQRYRMLYDSGPIPIGTAGGNKAIVSRSKKINLKGMKIDFSSTTTGFPLQNSIYVAAFVQQAPGAGPTYITNTVYGATTQFHFQG